MDFAGATTRELNLSSMSSSSSGRSFFDAKDQVRQATDIVDLVGSYLPLRRAGRGFTGLCPWHDDSKPSLQVNPERQSFRCWVCQIGGDVFNFVMQMEGVEFRESLQILADRAGIEIGPIPNKKTGPADPTGDKKTLHRAMDWAQAQYHQCFLHAAEAEQAREYVAGRGISPEMIQRFRIGFSPLDANWLLRRTGGDSRRQKVLEAIGILARPAGSSRVYDRFRGRLLFAVADELGKPVGIGSRLVPGIELSSNAKYVNSPETRLFVKNRLLYGLDLAKETMRKSRRALVMEGYTDVIAAHQSGLTDAVAVLGTALGENHIRILRRYVDQIVLILDGDQAGQDSMNRVLDLFVSLQIDLRVVPLPTGADPADFLREHGSEAMEQLIQTRQVDALEFAFQTLTTGLDVNRDIHRANEAMERLLSLIAKAPRLKGSDSTAHQLREQRIIQRIAALFRIEERLLRERLTALRRAEHRPRPSVPANDAASTSARPSARSSHPAEAAGTPSLFIQHTTRAKPESPEPQTAGRQTLPVTPVTLDSGIEAIVDTNMDANDFIESFADGDSGLAATSRNEPSLASDHPSHITESFDDDDINAYFDISADEELPPGFGVDDVGGSTATADDDGFAHPWDEGPASDDFLSQTLDMVEPTQRPDVPWPDDVPPEMLREVSMPAAIREMLELLIAQPQCLARLRETIDPTRMRPGRARLLLQTSYRLADEGIAVDYDVLMTYFDQPVMKSLLVELDESAAAKGHDQADWLVLLENLFGRLKQEEVLRERPAQLIALREGNLDAEKKREMLLRIIQQERDRQGISESTDG